MISQRDLERPYFYKREFCLVLVVSIWIRNKTCVLLIILSFGTIYKKKKYVPSILLQFWNSKFVTIYKLSTTSINDRKAFNLPWNYNIRCFRLSGNLEES